jgi:hypothetical protein
MPLTVRTRTAWPQRLVRGVAMVLGALLVLTGVHAADLCPHSAGAVAAAATQARAVAHQAADHARVARAVAQDGRQGGAPSCSPQDDSVVLGLVPRADSHPGPFVAASSAGGCSAFAAGRAHFPRTRPKRGLPPPTPTGTTVLRV